ncbi:hypothetical protein TPA0906_13130 [Streptomyces olivaceus]|nr:hypothetical protein TPA0906_13130 [Streptomyces olivaceus]
MNEAVVARLALRPAEVVLWGMGTPGMSGGTGGFGLCARREEGAWVLSPWRPCADRGTAGARSNGVVRSATVSWPTGHTVQYLLSCTAIRSRHGAGVTEDP